MFFSYYFAIDNMVGRMEAYTVYFISWCSLYWKFEEAILILSSLIPVVQKHNTPLTTKIKKKNQNPNKTKRKKHLIIKIKMENNDLFFFNPKTDRNFLRHTQITWYFLNIPVQCPFTRWFTSGVRRGVQRGARDVPTTKN